MALFGNVQYWDERYRDMSDSAYEWYQNYSSLRHLLTPEMLIATKKHDSTTAFPPREACRILILGCGNSRVGEDLLGDGWRGEIVNVDFSPVVISQMKDRYDDKFYDRFHDPRKMEFLCADVSQPLPFEDKSFDLIICKATLDAVLCSSGSVANAKRIVEESVRLLANGHGVFFLVSYANPDSRVVFLEHQNDLSYYWQEVSTHTVSRVNGTGNKNDYAYICRKRVHDIPTVLPKLVDETNSNAENLNRTDPAHYTMTTLVG